MSAREELSTIVLGYLSAAESRDLDAASAHLAPGADIVFPGGVHHRDLASVVEAARSRYRSVSKTFDAVDVDTESGTVIVSGRLSGENLHGVRFVDVRYVDRFHLVDGRIVLQHVWNDLEETRVLDAATTADLSEVHRPRG